LRTTTNKPSINANQNNGTSATQVTNNTSHTAITSQTGSFKSVKIGTQTWMAVNLNVDRFRNGDPIPEVRTGDEWEKAVENKQPAFRYYNDDPKNGVKYGKLYNWYAAHDPRGLAPLGWHMPRFSEWTQLKNYLNDNVCDKMKNTNGWAGEGCKKCDGGSEEFKKVCSACKGTQHNSTDPIVSNGSNSSGFSALPGGHCGQFFYGIGSDANWWCVFEGDVYKTYISLSHNYFHDDIGYEHYYGGGMSVRCIKD
jgi:uncharacterized protein (TIGR02145 family)